VARFNFLNAGGVRVIYFNYTEEGVLELFAVYAKSERENMPASQIKRNRRA